MRRPDTIKSYQPSTRDVISFAFDPWQLSVRDEREKIHKLINSIQCIKEDYRQEINYIRNKFIPELMDLNETWMVYRNEKGYAPNDLFIDNVPLTEVVEETNDLDDIIDGKYNKIIHSSDSETTINIDKLIPNAKGYHVLSGSNIYFINRTTNQASFIYSGNPEFTDTIVREIDNNNRYLPIETVFDIDSITVTALTMQNPYFTIRTKEQCTGMWNSQLDFNGDGIIAEEELRHIRNALHLKAADMTPEEWQDFAPIDFDNTGYISDENVDIAERSVFSVQPGIEGFLYFPTFVGNVTLRYRDNSEDLLDIVGYNDSFREIRRGHSLEGIKYPVKDSLTGLTFGTVNQKNIYVIETNVHGDIIGEDVIFIHTENPDYEILGTDINSGYLFILVRDDDSYFVYSTDIWSEYVTYMNERIEITDTPENPKGLCFDHDGTIIIYGQNGYSVYELHRDRFIHWEDLIVFNNKYSLTLEDETPVPLYPQPVFNSFDSFAFSLGITRPPGSDNRKMKELINDFFVHENSNSEIGMNYGILRELGFTNSTLIPETNIHYLSNNLDITQEIQINDSTYILSEEEWNTGLPIIAIYVGNGNKIGMITPSSFIIEGPITTNKEITICGHFIDGNEDTMEICEIVPIFGGSKEYPITVSQLTDPEHIENIGAGVLKDIIKTKEQNSIYRVDNFTLNSIDIGNRRYPSSFIVPTEYSSEFDITEYPEIEL